MELRTPHANGDSVLAKLDDFFIKLAVIAFALETLGAASEGARAAGGEDGGTLRRRRPEFDSCVVERHVREALLGQGLLDGSFGGFARGERLSKLEQAVAKLEDAISWLERNGGKLGENEGTLAFILSKPGDALRMAEENDGATWENSGQRAGIALDGGRTAREARNRGQLRASIESPRL